MAKQATLEEVESLSKQLPLKEQLKLLSRLSDYLTDIISALEVNGKTQRHKRAMAILRECDLAAGAFTKKTDSVATINRLRDERHHQLCQSE